MTDVQWICLTILVAFIFAGSAWIIWAVWQASQKKQTDADSDEEKQEDDLVVAVTQRMAQAQADGPADDAALQARLKAGTL
ncbi:hypothetical protein FOH24_12945 [Acetobacter tropicalis]|uniref:Uncharacterized protein n=1 Tax=Acetobacter tropicalis TaxID=104102 RepID=A0A094YQF5_9PROT|nr:hypothetical protein [Acetobacter tropicalis]KAA8387884.1 hypothetical protein FOH24_12945 [Acetobacter tropicalis]KAA8388797.1 hypothetical protein FOH22_08255 [Acetobacter tropicalis]KGB24280.1 hypothetical protein AtDm6_1278 [Acetobacter tropicalis]MDO8172365.1 hypothetical protein [Acetobacter tropicalis]